MNIIKEALIVSDLIVSEVGKYMIEEITNVKYEEFEGNYEEIFEAIEAEKMLEIERIEKMLKKK